MMQIRLLLDEDVHAVLAQALRKRGYDAVHIQELQRKGLSDRDQLKFGISQGRCLISFNVRDFVLLHNECVTNNQDHCGILVSAHLPVGETLRRVLVLLSTTTAEQMQNQLIFLQ
jgi:predicted nuclease of predicted toxin-antitoxin system